MWKNCERELRFPHILFHRPIYWPKSKNIDQTTDKITALITQILILTFFVSCSNNREPASEKKPRTIIVFALITQLSPPSISKTDSHAVTVEGETYCVNDGVVEMIEKLSKRDNVDIYFSVAERNQET